MVESCAIGRLGLYIGQGFLCLIAIAISLLAPQTSDALVEDRIYFGANMGFIATHVDYNIVFGYDGTYDGYKTTTAASTTCTQCTDPTSGLQKRLASFSGTYSMTLDSGYFFSLVGGMDITECFSAGVQLSYTGKKESAFDNVGVTIDSGLWSLLINIDYMLFPSASQIISPYIGVGAGMAHYSASGSFVVRGANSVSNVVDIPNQLYAKGDFDSLSDYAASIQIRGGAVLCVSEFAAVDFGLRYMSIGNIGTDSNTAIVTRADEIVQDPGAAQNPGVAGCNGNAAAFCPNAVGLLSSTTEPITFPERGLYMSSIRSNNAIFDIGIRLFF